MNCEEYRKVWETKYLKYDDYRDENPDGFQKDPNKTVDNEDIDMYGSDDNVYDQPTTAYRWDLANHKLVWTGNFWPDLWFYVKQEHPLLSICLSEQVHPYGRWERFFIELFIFALASMWAASVTRYMVAVETNNEYVDFVAYWGYSILGGLIKTVVNSILKMMATCTCKQQGNTRARVKYEKAGYVCMVCWGIISLGLFAIGLWFVVVNDREGEKPWGLWILSLCVSYVSGWIISIIITFVLFILCYQCCMKNDYKFKFEITYQDYLNWYDEHGEEDENGVISSPTKGKYNQVAQNDTTEPNHYEI